MLVAARTPARMSFAEFLAWEPGDGRMWQLVGGEPHQMAPTNRTHSLLQNQLGHLLAAHFERTGSRCWVASTPGVLVPGDRTADIRIPDLAVTCTPCVQEEALLGEPVLLVEVLSPSNQAETWSNL